MDVRTTFCLAVLLITAVACETSILPSEDSLDLVPETVVGARPIYADFSLPAPSVATLPDTSSAPKWKVGNYLVRMRAYKGVELWSANNSSRDTLPVAFIKVEGLLDYRRENSQLYLARCNDAFVLNLNGITPEAPRVATFPKTPDPFRFLTQTLGIQGYVYYSEYYLECPDTTRCLAGFIRETLTSPTM